MSGRSLLAASFLLLAMGQAAPGAARVIEDPHWRTIAGDETPPQLHRSAQRERRDRIVPSADATAHTGF